MERRIAVLWSELPGYAAACLRALCARDGVKLLVARYAHTAEKAFSEKSRNLPVFCHAISPRQSGRAQWAALRPLLEAFQPNAALVSGWAIAPFNRAARWVRRRGGLVVCMSDNRWRGDARQRMGAVYARLLFWRRYSAMFVPGERARPLALAFGFSGRRLLMGSYSCDWRLFAEVAVSRAQHGKEWPRAFLFVGSLIERKGMLDLLESYAKYRRRVVDPWGLRFVGDGPLRHLLEGVDGVKAFGFRQPAELPDLMREAGGFVLPSLREPWGVVVHEATAAGLPVICTHQAGSGAELVRDHYNGYLFDAGDVGHLTDLMVELSRKPDGELREMGRRSHELSKQYTPDLWADRLLHGLDRLPRPDEGIGER